MPRKLPWATSILKPPTSRSSPPNKRRRTSVPTSSSSSPAPARKPIPPTTTTTATDKDGDSDKDADLSIPVYMLPSDERYIMVEDEFLSVAQTYTRSLHRAEYERLQRLAKTTHARRITEIQRPVAGVQRMSKAAVLKKDDSDSDSDEDVVVHNVWGKSSLGLLMCRPKDEEKDLSVSWKVGAGARPAAKVPRAAKGKPLERPGVKRERPVVKREPVGRLQSVKESTLPVPCSCASTASEETSDDDDDLDAPVVRKNQAQTQNQTKASATSLRSSPPSFPSSLSSMPSFSQPQSSQPGPYLRPSQIKREIPDFDFGFEAVNQRSAAYRGRAMARRQAESLAHKR
ncbi:hypothetical protein P167DRAFT_537464 [Morchella conica CCBAS932]|uniref:Something about silencing protein 4 domain-containing protein n=1 Tax=Morchella conica CCBAS932 TaxID=1392247 RepID=A0A3N4KJ09_9PEZI|nr:hypothetical protein P167DRAFT_537464 [Morchella conica CCBAS932]